MKESKLMVVLLMVFGSVGTFFSLPAQSPLWLYETPPRPELQLYYQQRGVKSYMLSNFQIFKGDTVSRGVYKYMEFDPFGRVVYDSTATAMGRQYRFLYDQNGLLSRISKRTMKGDGYILLFHDSLNRKMQEVEISHRQDTNEVRTYFYNEDNQLIRTLARNAATTTETTFEYDPDGRLLRELSTTQTIKGDVQTGTIYLMDDKGFITGLRELKDGSVRQVDNYQYNAYGQITERRLPGKGEYYRYYYNGTGLLKRVEVYDINRHSLKGWQLYEYTFY